MNAYSTAYQDDQQNSLEERYIFGSAFVEPKLFSHRLGKKTVHVWKFLQRLQAKGSTSKKTHYVWCSINGVAKRLGMTHSEVAWAFTKLKKFDLLTPAPADLENELYIGWREHGDHDVYYRRVYGKEITKFDSEQNCNRSVFQIPKSAETKLREKSNHGGTRKGAGPQATILGRIEALKNLPQFADRRNLLIYFLKNFPDQDSDENRAAIFSERPPMLETFEPSPKVLEDINSTNFGQKTYNTVCEINPSQACTGSESTTYQRTDLKNNKESITSLSTNSSREEMFVAVANVAAALVFVTTKNLNETLTACRPLSQVASQPSQAVGEAAPQTNSQDKKDGEAQSRDKNQDENQDQNLNFNENLNEDLVQIQSVNENDGEAQTLIAYRPTRVAPQPSQVDGAEPQTAIESQTTRDEVDDVSASETTSRLKASAPRLRADAEKVSRATNTDLREGFRAPPSDLRGVPRAEILRDGRLDFSALVPLPTDWPALPAPASIPETWASSTDEDVAAPSLPLSLETWLPPPPTLPDGHDSDLDAEVVMSAYRAVATRHMGKQSFTLAKKGMLKKSKYFQMAVSLASVLRKHDLAPMVWFEWSFGKWRGDSQPPLNFLLSSVRAEKYFDWCEREMSALTEPRKIRVPSFDALSRRCWMLQETLAQVSKSQRRSVIEFFFSNHLFEEMLEQAKKDREKIRETIKFYMAGGRAWIWG